MIMIDRSRPLSAAFVLILAGALALGLRLAEAAYPERYITIICASGAGGIVDVTTRILPEHMSRTLRPTVGGQNEPGAHTTPPTPPLPTPAPARYPALTLCPPLTLV